MVDIKIYTTTYCPYCVRAKSLLKSKAIPYEEIDVTTDHDLRERMVVDSGRRTVPQIFIGGRSIGGFEELKALNETGELDALVSAAEPEATS
jgi:glutaredoxin 3